MHEESSVLRDVSRYTDQELIAKLRGLVRADRALSVQLLVHLGEVDARGLYREQAYTSMFDYAVRALYMSDAEAFLRIQVARLGRQFPRVLELLGSGALHLTAIKLLAPHLTPDNHVQLLERARGKSKREVERLVAEIAPKPDVPNQLRKLPQPLPRTRHPQQPEPLSPRNREPQQAATVQGTNVVASGASRIHPDDADAPSGATPVSDTSASLSPSPEAGAVQASLTAPVAISAAATTRDQPAVTKPSPADVGADAQKSTFVLQPPRSRASCAPLSPGRYKLQLSVGQALHDKLEQLQDLLRHRVPDGNLASIVELAVDMLVEKTLKQRFAQSSVANKPPRARSAARDKPRPDQRAPREHEAKANSADKRLNQSSAAEKRVDESSAADTRVDESKTADTQADESRTAETRVDESRAAEKRVDESRVGDVGASQGLRSREARLRSRYVPRSVLREVYARDGGQCTFVSADGQRCAARGLLEFHHHHTPFALGGAATVDNLRLMCPAHNALQAERDYGREFMLHKAQ